jgi:mono/diheme cytochrome c family protein
MSTYQFDLASPRTSSSTAGWGVRVGLVTAALWMAMLAFWPWEARGADKSQIERGKYLVALGGCGDCHTPGYFLGKPDSKRELGGSEVGFEIPGLGVFYGPNLTPDKETGLGAWSLADIVKALQTGVRPDGRGLVPVMPWPALAKLTPADAQAIAAYLKSLPPVKNKVPGPFGAGETPTSFVMKVVPPPKP